MQTKLQSPIIQFAKVSVGYVINPTEPTNKNIKENMTYLIIKEIKLSNTSIYNVVSFTDNLDKANDMLQGYNLIEKDKKNVVYSIAKYEQPLKLTKEMEC